MMKKGILHLAMILCPFLLGAQTLHLSLTQDSITIGDQFELFVQSQVPADSFSWLKEQHDFENFEIIEYGAFQDRSDAQDRGFEQRLWIQAWEEGMQQLPPMPYILNGDSLATDSLLIPVYPFPIDTANLELRPARGLKDAPFEWYELKKYWWILPILLVGLMLFFLYKYWQRRQEGVEAPEVVIPAHEWAFSQLGQLQGENLPEKGDYKEFYSRLSYILRAYIERRYDIPALERTTREILKSGIEDEIDSEQYAVLKQGLERADRVKYAKFTPDTAIHNRAWQSIWNFVDLTKQKTISNE